VIAELGKHGPLADQFIPPEGGKKKPHQNLTFKMIMEKLKDSKLVGQVNIDTLDTGFLSASGSDHKKTIKRATKFLNFYFQCFKDASPEAWEAGMDGWLRINPAIQAHFKLFANIFQHIEQSGQGNARNFSKKRLEDEVKIFIEPVTEFITTQKLEGIVEEYKSDTDGDGAVTEYHKRLVKRIKDSKPEFLENQK
jgi:hypothetical protein